IDNLEPGLSLCDTGGRYLLVNPSFCRLVGLDPHQIVGRKPDQVHPPELADQIVTDCHEALEIGQRQEKELIWEQEDRTLILKSVRTPVRDASGNIRWLV